MIHAIHQIEITSRCNLRCRYCTHPKMQRTKEDMTVERYLMALSWVRRYVERGTQHELNLAGIGESTMHPDFTEFVRMAREAVGDHVKLVLATNGVVMTQEIADCLAEYDVWTWVSLHRPEKAGPAIEMLKAVGVLKGVSADPSVSAVDWAGQVEWHTSVPFKAQPCQWLAYGRAFVMADGSVAQCCFDAEGISKVGSIYDNLDELDLPMPFSLCSKCHLAVPSVVETDHAAL